MGVFDLQKQSLRELNAELHRQTTLLRESGRADTEWQITNPRGSHAVAVGIDGPLQVGIQGSVGYYCGGMNQLGQIQVNGSVGPGVGENMMSGSIRVTGDASQYAGATGRGGQLIIEGNASSRCGISIKGIDIVVRGDVGHMSAFMAQRGNLVVLGNAGDALGDSIYEAVIYVRGEVGSLGADCVEKEMTDAHVENLATLLQRANIEADAKAFRRYGSARRLYNFDVDNVGQY